MESINYQQKFVAFIDILGYKDLLYNSERDGKTLELITLLERLLKENITWKKFNYPDEFKIKMFSDCISLSVPHDIVALAGLLAHLATIQSELINNQILIRGAVTVGNHYESENLIFSKALIDAYEIESKKAIYPRIIIDEQIVNIIGNSDKNTFLRSLILKDYDNQLFLDYLFSYWNQGDCSEGVQRILKVQRNLILTSRSKHKNEPVILQKLAWLSLYHNQTVKNIQKFDELVVNEEFYFPKHLENRNTVANKPSADHVGQSDPK